MFFDTIFIEIPGRAFISGLSIARSPAASNRWASDGNKLDYFHLTVIPRQTWYVIIVLNTPDILRRSPSGFADTEEELRTINDFIR